MYFNTSTFVPTTSVLLSVLLEHNQDEPQLASGTCRYEEGI